MNDKRVDIDIQVDLFAISPTHGAYIHLSSVTHDGIWGRIGPLTVTIRYNNGELYEIDDFRCDKGNYFNNILDI